MVLTLRGMLEHSTITGRNGLNCHGWSVSHGHQGQDTLKTKSMGLFKNVAFESILHLKQLPWIWRLQQNYYKAEFHLFLIFIRSSKKQIKAIVRGRAAGYGTRATLLPSWCYEGRGRRGEGWDLCAALRNSHFLTSEGSSSGQTPENGLEFSPGEDVHRARSPVSLLLPEKSGGGFMGLSILPPFIVLTGEVIFKYLG